MRATSSKLDKLKAKDVKKLIDKKEEMAQQPKVNPALNIYDNSSLFKREAIEAKIESHQALLGGGFKEPEGA